MSSNGHGHNKAPSLDGWVVQVVGQGYKAPSLDGWVVQVVGQGSIVGKIKGNTEAGVRDAMRGGTVAPVTLDPAYMFASTVTMIDMGQGPQPGRIFVVSRLEQAIDLGPKARLPFHCVLDGCAFLSELDEASRAHVWKRIEDSDRRQAAANSGLILAPARLR